jgi:hypothetical protein
MAEQTRQRYEGSIGGYQAVVGPKDASQLELVLNTIFIVGEAPALFPLQACIDLRSGRGISRRGQVRYAIPQARGDSVSRHAFPVVATLDEMFSLYRWRNEPLPFAAGGPFRFGWDDLVRFAEELTAWENGRRAGEVTPPPRPRLHDEWKQCVIGSRVARTLGLDLGATVVPVHGRLGEFGYHEHAEAACRVAGVLAPTNSPLDTTIFLPLAVHYLIGGHEAGVFVVEIPPGKSPEDAKELPVSPGRLGLTAIVVDPKDHFGARILRTDFGSRPDAQVAWPQDVVPKFLRQVGNAADVLIVIAWLVLLVASVSITVAIYNTMNERRREIAIMRSLGARRGQILAIIVGEAATVSFVGAVLGLVVCHGTAWLLRETVEDTTGVWLDPASFQAWEAALVGGVTVLGAVAGVLPAVKGSMTQVADNLAQDT